MPAELGAVGPAGHVAPCAVDAQVDVAHDESGDSSPEHQRKMNSGLVHASKTTRAERRRRG